MGFYHVGQAGFELLTSGDLPTSASQNAGITSVSHCTRSISFNELCLADVISAVALTLTFFIFYKISLVILVSLPFIDILE